MKFPYKKLSTGISRPIIPVDVFYKGKLIKYFALIDSGADINIFQKEIGDILGIDIESGRHGMVTGVVQADAQDYFIHPVTIQVGGWKYNTEVAFMPNLSKNGHGLLGQKGFFNLFIIKFDNLKQEIELKEYIKKTK